MTYQFTFIVQTVAAAYQALLAAPRTMAVATAAVFEVFVPQGANRFAAKRVATRATAVTQVPVDAMPRARTTASLSASKAVAQTAREMLEARGGAGYGALIDRTLEARF